MELLFDSKPVQIKEGWHQAGRRGYTLGPDVNLGVVWTPIMWEDGGDPEFHKKVGLVPQEKIKPKPASKTKRAK